MTAHDIHHLDFGMLLRAQDPRWSLVVNVGTHLDEIAGMEAGSMMISYIIASINGSTFTVKDVAGKQFRAPGLPLDGCSVLMVPRLNPNPWATRRYGELPGHGREISGRVPNRPTGVDLNRTWPGHAVVAPVWRAIQELPRPVVVLDIHDTGNDRWGDDGIPDPFIYAMGHSRAWLEPIGKGWRFLSSPEPGALEDVAHNAGHIAATVEFGALDGAPGPAACQLLLDVVSAGPPPLLCPHCSTPGRCGLNCETVQTMAGTR